MPEIESGIEKARAHGPMAPMNDEAFRKARRKVRDAMMRLARWKLREMRDKYIGRPRTHRLGKEARALKALLRDTSDSGK